MALYLSNGELSWFGKCCSKNRKNSDSKQSLEILNRFHFTSGLMETCFKFLIKKDFYLLHTQPNDYIKLFHNTKTILKP